MPVFRNATLLCLMVIGSVVLINPIFAGNGGGFTKPAATQPTNLKSKNEKSKNETAPATQPAKTVGWLEISGELKDAPPPYIWARNKSNGHSLSGVIERLNYVAKNKQCQGVVLYLDEPELQLAQIDEIVKAVARVRAAGKKVLAFSQAYDFKSYLLACSADKILLQNKGMLEINGIGIEEMYFAGLFEKIGVKADFLQVGKFKGAEEPFTRKGPSESWNANIDGLLTDLYDSMITTIGDARKMKKADVEKAITDSWSMSDEDYVKRGLVDALTNRDMVEITEPLFGEEFTWEEDFGKPDAQKIDSPFAVLQLLFKAPQASPTRSAIALIHANGEISSGDGGNGKAPTPGLALFEESGIGSRSLIRALGKVHDEDHILGAVIRIDSPGGSALASEAIWQAIHELAQDKPVFISVGPMAASGGYYIACAGNKIYVTPDSIVGSIGVVGGKFTMGGLYEKLGLGVYRRGRGPMADMFNSIEPFTPEQRVALEASFKRTYDLFLQRVNEGRGDQIKVIDDVAQGRLFSGRQAVKNGLADKIGGLEVVLDDMASECKLKQGEYDIIDLPEPMTLQESLEQMFGSSMESRGIGMSTPQFAVMLQTIRASMNNQQWHAARAVLSGMLLMQHEPVLTLMPSAIVVR